MNWVDNYPHMIYANVLLLDGKIIDYKIGNKSWESPYDITIRGQISFDNLGKCIVKNTSWKVNNQNEHNSIFNNEAKEWIEKQINGER
ncbi:MAG: hypothetical protein ACFFCV_20000 [Promethearchaeota archaeon]